MESLKLNSGLALLNSSKVSSDAREQLVMEGQALVLESVGMAKNKALSKAQRPTVDFGSSFKSASDYEKYARKWTDDVLHFCAKKVNDFNGTRTSRDEKATFTDPRLAANPMYLQLMSSVMNDVLYTTTPYVVNELVGDMVSTVTTPKGQTYTAGITSNAVFQWHDTTWTSLRSVPEDQLYHKTIALNPTPRACRGRINYYQMVGNGLNMVDTLAALAGGYGAMIMRIFTDAFTKAAADTTYVPAALTATGYTDQNWAKIVQNVAKANRVRRTDIIGYGNFLALRKVLPDNTGLASAIMMQLGNRVLPQRLHHEPRRHDALRDHPDLHAGYHQHHDGRRIPQRHDRSCGPRYGALRPDDLLLRGRRSGHAQSDPGRRRDRHRQHRGRAVRFPRYRAGLCLPHRHHQLCCLISAARGGSRPRVL